MDDSESLQLALEFAKASTKVKSASMAELSFRYDPIESWKQ